MTESVASAWRSAGVWFRFTRLTCDLCTHPVAHTQLTLVLRCVSEDSSADWQHDVFSEPLTPSRQPMFSWGTGARLKEEKQDVCPSGPRGWGGGGSVDTGERAARCWTTNPLLRHHWDVKCSTVLLMMSGAQMFTREVCLFFQLFHPNELQIFAFHESLREVQQGEARVAGEGD